MISVLAAAVLGGGNRTYKTYRTYLGQARQHVGSGGGGRRGHEKGAWFHAGIYGLHGDESADTDPAEYAWDVLYRTIGEKAESFQLNLEPRRKDGLIEFSVEAKDGQVTVNATSAIGLCRGAYEYLRDACHVQVNWSESNVEMPEVLPDFPLRHVLGPNRFRLYYNICTFGYSTVWWDWKRWRHEIDWMALHGINMPLALNGQELIWQRVFRGLNIPDASISKFFCGPAFSPWHWMGNQNGNGGPLPQSWIDGQAALQHQILDAERNLGMRPVVSGFSGFVPTDFKKFYPEVNLFSPTAWAGFEATTFVDPRSPMFVKIGQKYVSEYRKEFGSVPFYLCDTFNEQNPQFPKATELSDLAACGKATYNSISSVDPDARWVMQGWLFRNAPDYWTEARADALVSQVPKHKIIILDLDTVDAPVWKRLAAVRNGDWIFNSLHNYGQNTELMGDLQHYADRAASDLNDPGHGEMIGMGLTPEGIDQNPVLYELMTDAMWRPDRIQVEGDRHTTGWIEGYVTSRYGFHGYENADLAYKAWKLILPEIYSSGGGSDDGAWRYRPNLSKISPPSRNVVSLRRAVEMLTELRARFSNRLLDRDLVDLTKTWLSALADMHLAAAVATFDGDREKYTAQRDAFFDVLHDLDRVMAVMPEHRLSKWISDARTWGKTPEEKDLMERNARMQITIWGGPELYDYANKEWAGLNEDFIRPRWRFFFDALEKAGSLRALSMPDFAAWETRWTEKTSANEESLPEPILGLAQELLAKYTAGPNLSELLGINPEPGIAVGAKVWDSGHTEGDHKPQFIVDGRLNGGYWSASPAPQWVEIDLGMARPVSGTWLFPYYGDGRVYSYKVAVSTDNVHWVTVADGSSNQAPATYRGYRDSWAPMLARYLRVTMLHNSANIGVHLYEVRVLGPSKQSK